jgi:glycerol-3-phosphate dehydrogenase
MLPGFFWNLSQGKFAESERSKCIYKAEARNMSDTSVQEYRLSKCKQLVPSFDPKEIFHAFCGARAKNTRGDWIVEPSAKSGTMIHMAGIDSPGLAGSPAIALEVVRLLQQEVSKRFLTTS